MTASGSDILDELRKNNEKLDKLLATMDKVEENTKKNV